METNELLERYFEETNILEDDSNCVIIAYGSRIYGSSSNSSDLDIFVGTLSRGNYRESQLIDGINVETNFISIELLMEDIYSAYLNNNTYYESVFNSGIVLKNEAETLEMIKKNLEDVKNTTERKKHSIPVRYGIQIHEYLDGFRTSTGNLKDYYYYNLLELIRNTYHYVNNYSYLNSLKTYGAYTNPTYSEEIYKMILPPAQFRDAFLSAIGKEESMDTSINLLLDFLNYSKTDYIDPIFSKEGYTFIDNLRIKKILISLNKMICKLEDMLIYNHPSVNYVYYVFLDHCKRFFKEIYKEESEEFDELYNAAINTLDVDERINLIEKLFWLIEKDYKFDYDDYVLRYE